MKMIYRGIVVEHQPRSGNTGKPTPPSQTQPYTLCYRGVRLTIDPNAPKPNPPYYPNGYDLIYRGVKLHVSPQGGRQTVTSSKPVGLLTAS